MKIFGLEISKTKAVHAAEPVVEKAAMTSGSFFQQVHGFGMRLTAYDYVKDSATLTAIAKYNPWVASSIRAITRNSIQPVLKVWNPATQEDVERDDLLELIRRPHPDFTEAKFRKYLTFYHEYFGIAFIYKVRAGNKVIALQPLPSDRVQLNPTLIAKGVIGWQLVNGGQPIDLPTEDLIVWADDEFIDQYYTGGTKLNHLLFAVANKNNADRFNKSTIENGGEVKGVLYTEAGLQQKDIDLYEKQLKKRYGGADNGGKTMILGSGLRYEKTGATIQEMAFDQLQKVSREEVLAVYKVPPVELGLTDSVNYSNAQAQRKLFWETTLIPTFDAFASALTEGLLKTELKSPQLAYYFDYSAIAALQTDLNTKLQSAQIMQFLGYDNGTITEYLDLPELEEAPEPVIETPKNIIIPAKFKSVYRDSMKDLFGRSHAFVEGQFKRSLEKYFLGWRNDILDFIKKAGQKDAMNQKDKLIQYIEKRTDLANSDLKAVGAVFYGKITKDIVQRMIDKYGLKWVESARQTITTAQHMENFTLINKTVDEQLKEAIREAYLTGLQNNNSTGEMADAFIEATKKVYKLADNRAILIARTETTSLSNDMMLDQYHENDVEAREWLTAQDGDVRSIPNGDAFDHSVMDEKKAKLGESFIVPSDPTKTGSVFEKMNYPGDMANGSPGNICNCRCSTMPV